MKKLLKSFVITICTLGLVIFFGCTAFQDEVTPVYINPKIIASVEKEVNVPAIMPFTSMGDAKRVSSAFDYKYNKKRTIDRLDYNYLRSGLTESIESGQQFQQIFFSPTGPVGALLPATFAGTLALMAGGRYLKSPREKELEKIVNGNNKVA